MACAFIVDDVGTFEKKAVSDIDYVLICGAIACPTAA
jgi:hypothetical protein|tara:strand:+ start:18533 stop:18643 length:111 start_codon:yes stop_codon:yes gene_type:complete